MTKKVLIVTTGQWGGMQPTDYQPQIEMLERALTAVVPVERGQTERAANVELVATAEEAEQRAGSADAVVFITRGMAEAAEALAARHPKTRVVVWTGLIPDGKVIWVSKGWGANAELLRDFVLH